MGGDGLEFPKDCGGLVGALLAASAIWPAVAQADGTLDRIKETGEIRLAYRADASPFSYELDGKPSGYSVNLCLEVAKRLKEDLNLPKLTASFVKVTAENRFDAIAEGQADLLCEATTATLSRREKVDFSIYTFVSGASLVIRPGGPTSVDALAGHKIGVLGGTTTLQALDETLRENAITAEVIVVKTHDEGFEKLEKGEITAYFGDRTILEDRLRRIAERDRAAAGGQLPDHRALCARHADRSRVPPGGRPDAQPPVPHRRPDQGVPPVVRPEGQAVRPDQDAVAGVRPARLDSLRWSHFRRRTASTSAENAPDAQCAHPR